MTIKEKLPQLSVEARTELLNDTANAITGKPGVYKFYQLLEESTTLV